MAEPHTELHTASVDPAPDPDRRRPLDRLASDPRLAALRAGGDGTGIDVRFRRLSGLVAALLDVPTAYVSLVDEHRRFFSGARGLTGSVRQRRALPISETLCSHVAREGERLAIEDTSDHPVTLAHPTLVSEDVRAYLGVPIRDPVTDEVLGTLCAMDRRTRAWTEENIRILENVAAAAASEIGVRVVASQLEELHREQRFLAEVGATVASSLDLGRLAQRVAELAVSYFADGAVVALAAGGTAVTVAEPAEDGPALRQLYDTIRARGKTGSGPVLLGGPGAADDAWTEAAGPVGAHTGILVPVDGDDPDASAILLIATDAGRGYSDIDVHLAGEVARLLGLAVANARLYAEARGAVLARDDMLSVVSHDLRNPLGVISMAAQLLLDGADRLGPDESARYLSMVRRAADSALVLVTDLLEVAKLEAGQGRLDARPLDPTRLLAEVTESQRPLAATTEVRLERVDPGAVPPLRADRERLLRVFANLIGNALKFTERGGTVTIGGAPEEGGVRFFVRDTGDGIPPEHLDRLFTRFWQADDADRRGAGLGLSIVKAIVEAHRGRVWAESRVGTGTTIHFWLPADSESERRRSAAPAGAAPGERTENEGTA